MSLESTSATQFGQLRARVREIATFTLALNILGGVFAAWAYVWPYSSDIPVYVCIFMVPAAIAIKLLPGAKIELMLPRGETGYSLTCFYAAPAVAVSARALSEATFLSWEPVLLWAAIVGMVLTPVALIGDRLFRRKPSFAFLVLLLNTAYGFGAAAELNDLLDRAPPAIYRTQIINKQVGHGKITTLSVILGPWGSMPAGWSVNVSDAAFRSAHIGDTTCVFLRPGFFGFAHLNIGDCPV